MIKNGERIIVICRDRQCINNDYSTDTCNINESISIVKGKCVDKVAGKINIKLIRERRKFKEEKCK